MADVTAADVIRHMQRMQGGDWRYRFGAEVGGFPNNLSSKKIDCSEATEAAVRWAAEEKGSGLRLTDGSFAQHDACYNKGTLISLGEARNTPGSLVFLSRVGNVTPGMGRNGIYHVGLVLNADTVLEACCKNDDVIRPCAWNKRNWYSKGGRIPGVLYSTAPTTPPPTTTPPPSGSETFHVDFVEGGTAVLRYLKKGLSGRDVRETQVMLNDWGMGAGTVDGQAGSKFDAAVRKFQTSRGLTVDGIVGPGTHQSLMGR